MYLLEKSVKHMDENILFKLEYRVIFDEVVHIFSLNISSSTQYASEFCHFFANCKIPDYFIRIDQFYSCSAYQFFIFFVHDRNNNIFIEYVIVHSS